jgi:bacteriocin-like protein
MDTTNMNTSAMSEICELTDDELDAVTGGAVDAFILFGSVDESHKEGTVRSGQTINSPTKPHAP